MNKDTFKIDSSLPTAQPTALMSNAAFGCYVKLMCFAWRDGSIPAEVPLLARLCGEPPKQMEEIWREIKAEFMPDEAQQDRLIHGRVAAQRAAAERTKEARSKAGAIGANKRWKEPAPDARSKPNAAPAAQSEAAGQSAVQSKQQRSPDAAPSPALTGELFDWLDQATPSKAAKQQVADCPHEEIIELYHQRLPTCPRVATWNGTRAGHLRQRWKEMASTKASQLGNGYRTKEEGLAWWGALFDYIGQSKFLTGKAKPREGYEFFIASLPWIVGPQNFANILEGKYHRESGPQS